MFLRIFSISFCDGKICFLLSLGRILAEVLTTSVHLRKSSRNLFDSFFWSDTFSINQFWSDTLPSTPRYAEFFSLKPYNQSKNPVTKKQQVAIAKDRLRKMYEHDNPKEVDPSKRAAQLQRNWAGYLKMEEKRKSNELKIQEAKKKLALIESNALPLEEKRAFFQQLWPQMKLAPPKKGEEPRVCPYDNNFVSRFLVLAANEPFMDQESHKEKLERIERVRIVITHSVRNRNTLLIP
jgi:hypothetical protein